ncbi:MAG TPA: hypothetical protein VIS48_13745 [Candidatus Kryptonia bacterium]
MIYRPSNNGSDFPRELEPLERELVYGQLPIQSPTYNRYRASIDQMKIVGFGRRGAGHFVLAKHRPAEDIMDLVTPVFAIGGARNRDGELTVVIHEMEQESVSFELMAVRGEIESFMNMDFTRWSTSEWQPGSDCPKCSVRVKEVALKVDGSGVLAMCPSHRAIWVWDGVMQVNHIVPLTAFMNELNLQRALKGGKKIYRPPADVFLDLEDYSDSDFAHAFVLYNKYSHKLEIKDQQLVPQQKWRAGLFGRIFRGSRQELNAGRTGPTGHTDK